MIYSKLILDIFDLALDGYESADLVRSQLPFLTERKFDHTGVGLYVYFTHDNEAINYRVLTDCGTRKNDCVDVRLNGVEIRNEALNILADVDIILKNGIVDSVEIFNKIGEDYPLEEPQHYELYQLWLDPQMGRGIKR